MQTKTQLLPETGFLRERQILGDKDPARFRPPIIPISKAAWWAGVASGRYPKPVKLSARVTAWRVEDIRRLIDQLGTQGGVSERKAGVPVGSNRAPGATGGQR
jgi:hypothetical protein